MAKKHRYTIYLGSEDVASYWDILTDAGQANCRVGQATINPIRIDDENEVLSIIYHGVSSPPKWANQIAALGHFFPSDARGKYPSALVFLRVIGRIFVLSFGGGHHFLDKNKVVLDFGLKVVVNCIADDKIKALEKTNLSDLLRGMSQAAFEAGLQTFDVRSSLDIIQSIGGSVKDDVEIGEKASGSTALRITTQTQITSIADTCSDALEYYSSSAYRETRFAIIDNLFPVREEALIEPLTASLIGSIIAGDNNFELSIPELFSLEADISYARLTGVGHTEEYVDIDLELYRSILGKELAELSIDSLSKHKLEVFFGDGQKAHSSSVLKCLVGSLELDGTRYALNEGQWYRVNSAFKDQIEGFYTEHRDEALDNLFPPFAVVEKEPHKNRDKKKGTKVNGYEDELDYNTKIADTHKFVLLDQDTVPIPELPLNRVEICDFLDVRERTLYHVKKSSRSSSVLSHFFKQGLNSAQIIYNSKSFREAAEARISEVSGTKFSFEDLRDYTLYFVIADQERRGGGHNIPFFSKISFKDDVERVTPLVRQVRIFFISQPNIERTVSADEDDSA